MKNYDVILYGAGGFVGRQTVAYFAQHASNLRWALGGRNKNKLENIRRDAGPDAANAGIVVADAKDRDALNALAADARVVLNTAGPFSAHGSDLVAACVANNAHYVDITGETPWVRSLIDRHHAQAAVNGTRIIPCCGFDSVPSDVGAFTVAEAMLHRHDTPCVEVKSAISMRGGFNGGTLASTLESMDTGEARMMRDLFLLNPTLTRPKYIAAHKDPTLPVYDEDFRAWLCPFFMAVVNTRVVRRTAALLQGPYAPDFVYQEYMRAGRGPRGAAISALITAGTGAFFTALKYAPIRHALRIMGPAPGEGPSQRTMETGYMRCEFVGHSANGHTVRAVVSDRGDPGNRVTTKLVCEAALTLVHHESNLPGGTGFGGVLTPVTGLGAPYIARLRETGMQIKTIETREARPQEERPQVAI